MAIYRGIDNKTAIKELATELGLTSDDQDCHQDQGKRKQWTAKELVDTYRYRDGVGRVRYVIHRYLHAADARGKRKKSFSQHGCREDGAPARDMKGVEERFPFQYPEILGRAEGTTVFVCEGEKDCLSMAKIGLLATTNEGGAGKWTGKHSKCLEGILSEVVLIPDNDKAGLRHIEKTATSLLKPGIKTKILHLPEGRGKDVIEFLDEYRGTRRELEELAAKAKYWSSPPEDGVESSKHVEENILLSPFRFSLEETSYIVGDDGGVYAEKETKTGIVREKLSNFVAKPIKTVELDDGLGEPDRLLKIEGVLAAKRRLPNLMVKAEEFPALSWLAKWAPTANPEAGARVKDQLRHAIQAAGGLDVPNQTVYAHIGWRNIDGKWVYLHTGGAIRAPGVETQLGGPPRGTTSTMTKPSGSQGRPRVASS